MQIKGILIDLDDTLCNTKPLYALALEECRKIFNEDTKLNYSSEKFNQAYKDARDEAKSHAMLAGAKSNRAIYFQHLVANLPIETDFGLVNKLYENYYGYVYNNLKLFPGGLELLEWCKNNDLKIGIISDGNSHVKIKKIASLKISKYIDCLVSTEEVGIDKPASQSFLLALNKLRLHTDEVIYIGNKPSSDIKGAKQLGMVTIYTPINPTSQDEPQDESEKADYSAKNLEEVKEIIKKNIGYVKNFANH